jgi:death on curing protein
MLVNDRLSEIKYLTFRELVEANKSVLKEIVVRKADRHEVTSKAGLRHILETVENLTGDIYDKAALLLSELVRKHCFASANKRTAYASTRLFLETNGRKMRELQEPRILIGIREGFYNTEEITSWLKGNAIREFTRK